MGRLVTGESPHPFLAPEDRPAARLVGPVPFQAHVELLQLFLAHREPIVERIQGELNAQRKPIQYLQDVGALYRHFEDCFFTLPEIPRDRASLRRQLEEAHWASGFKPRAAPGLHNDIVDPAEMMSRAFRLWQHTRWPGHEGRVRYGQTLFNLYLLRRLMLLCMRVWDAGSQNAGDRLARIQAALDELWRTSPADQPVLVRDARWLFPLAQSPTTDELWAYFTVAEQIAESLSEEDRVEIHNAGVRMAGGHLRSQLRHVATQKGVSFEDTSVILSTRTSNALDLATLIQGLVPLLEAYEHAIQSGDRHKRLESASAICQGISPDPELFLNRLDLLAPYSMIEHLFITTDPDGNVSYTRTGRRHLRLLEEYETRIGRMSKALHDDCSQFRPVDGTYSPYGVLYGFSSNLLEHMALKTLTAEAVPRFSLEDVFADGGADKRAWVSGWRRLPHIKPEVAKLFEYPQKFAEDMFTRIERALRQRVADREVNPAVQTGRLFVLPADDAPVDSETSPIADLAPHYFRSSDPHVVAAQKVDAWDESRLLHSRNEGEFLVSFRTAGGWLAITKDVLTLILGAGRDVKIVGLPRVAAHALKLMCPDLVVLR
jgi:hypothetical protein